MTNSLVQWNSQEYFRLFDEANSGNNTITISGINETLVVAVNQSHPYRTFDGTTAAGIGGGGNGSGGAFDSGGNKSTFDDSVARPNYETGSNFMLLLEDFGEYFYNYNGSGPISISNSTDFPTNCSVTNSSCVELNTSK